MPNRLKCSALGPEIEMSVIPFQVQGRATRLRLDEIDHPFPNDDAVGRRGSLGRNIASLDVDANALGLAIKRRATPAAARRVDMDDVTGLGDHDVGIAQYSLPVRTGIEDEVRRRGRL